MSTGPTAPVVDRALPDHLVAATLDLVSTEGLHAVTVRRVSRMCGVSTMAVYSNFSGMPELIRAVGSAGFAQLSDRFAACGITDDPITDLLVLGMTFREEARRRPELFGLMFGTGSIRINVKIRRGNVVAASSDSDFENYRESFDHVVDATRRARERGLIDTPDPRIAAAQVWAGLYGFVQLEMAGHLGDDALLEVLVPATVNILVGMGAERETVGESVRRALERTLTGGAESDR